jgi:DNA-binding CsgD family transcriptional regulator
MRLGDIHFQPKELAVLRLIAAGENNKDIANILGTTRHVIKNYVRRILDKTGHSNRVELAMWFVKNNSVASL